MVYILRQSDSDYYKIGYTDKDSADARLASLQTGNPRRLIIVGIITDGTLEDEALLHCRLSGYRTDGGDEWFELPAEVAQKILEEGVSNGKAEWTGHYRAGCEAGGIYAADVRQVSGGQQDAVAARIQDVFHAGWKDAVPTSDQPIIFPIGTEYDKRCKTDWGQEGQ